MAILLVLADAGSSVLLQRYFVGWGEETLVSLDPKTACDELVRPSGPRLAVIDCAMPGEGGLSICRRVRAADALDRPYLILLGMSRACPDVSAALACGADDYVPYPVALDELVARVEVGKRTLAWQQRLLGRCVPTDEKSAGKLLALCAYCKAVRVGDAWKPIEATLGALGQECTHTICPTCYDSRVRPELAGLAGEAG